MKNNKLILLTSLFLLLGVTGCSTGGTSSSSNENSSSSQLSSENPSSESSISEESSSKEEELKETTIFLVGDSTVCSFNDSTYFYPRYGYGTQIGNYYNDLVTVKNLALSGRSSKNFPIEDNYQVLQNEISEGDYLIIGFGHNDEKSDDPGRFTDASKPSSDPESFGWHLNTYYVQIALQKGAIPILCTPIVRASTSSNYEGSNGHITGTGNYAQAILDLAQEQNITSIDLTSLTKNLYTELGYDEAIYFHAMTQGVKDGDNVVPNTNSVDTTHLNIYGAKMVSYLFTTALKETDCSLKNYIDNDKLVEPTKENDLVSNPDYVVSDYAAPDLTNYAAPDHLSTTSEGWYGTGFGDTGGKPESNGYIAKETSTGVFQVGNANGKGKFSSTTDGFAFAFRQVDASKNFTLTASAKVLSGTATNQAGWGLMLRDDAYLPKDDKSIISNYVTAGLLANSNDTMNALFYRENAVLNKGDHKVQAMYEVNDTAELSIVRLGQRVTVTVVYENVTYTMDHIDFDFNAKDKDYMYVGMFANRGTVIEFSNVTFEITGDSMGA